MVSFTPFIVTNDINCGICLDTLKVGEVIAHEGGEQHPMHRECVELWVQAHPSCPTCRKDVVLPKERFSLDIINRIDLGGFVGPSEFTFYRFRNAASIILITTVAMNILQFNLGGNELWDTSILIAGASIVPTWFANVPVVDRRFSQILEPAGQSVVALVTCAFSLNSVAMPLLEDGITLPNVVRIVSVGAGVIYTASVIGRITKRILDHLFR